MEPLGYLMPDPVIFTDAQVQYLERALVPAAAVAWLAQHCANMPNEMKMQASERTAGESRNELVELAGQCDDLRKTLERISQFTMVHVDAWYVLRGSPPPSTADLCKTLRFLALAASSQAGRLPQRSKEKPAHRWAFYPVVDYAACNGIDPSPSGALLAMLEVVREYLPSTVKVPKDLRPV